MVPAETIRRATLWTTLAVSAFASIEPSPYEFMFAALVVVFARRHLIFDKTLAPLIFTMAIYNVAGFIALAPYVGESRSVTYTYTTVYISLTMIVFAALVADAPEARMKTIRSGYVFAALLASALALLGYFDVVARRPTSRSTKARARWGRSKTPTCSRRSSSCPFFGSFRTFSSAAGQIFPRSSCSRRCSRASA